MHSKADVDADLGIFDVQKLDTEPVLLFDEPAEGKKAAFATVVAPNAKCSSCYHYQDHNTACAIGEQPNKCGIGDDAESGYAPLVMNADAQRAWKEKRKGAVAEGGHADASLKREQAPMKIEVLGHEKLELSFGNVRLPVYKSEHRPPSSWLRYMGRHLKKSENPTVVAASIWWSRYATLPVRFEKGLFQEVMTRIPTEAEVARAEENTRQPEGMAKSEWRRCCIAGPVPEEYLQKGNPANKAKRKSYEKRRFATGGLPEMSRDAFIASGRAEDKGTAVAHTHAAAAHHNAATHALQLHNDTKLFAMHTAQEYHHRSNSMHEAAEAERRRDPKKRLTAARKDAWFSAKKSLSSFDFNDYKDAAKLKNDELESYLQGYLEAAARDECRDLRIAYENQWWRDNRNVEATNGPSTFGDLEAKAVAAPKTCPAYLPDHDEISRRVWQRLIAKLPHNKNLLAAKRSFGLTQDAVKSRLKGVSYAGV